MPEFTTNEAIVLSTKPLGEATFIISLFTKEHGRHLGVIKKKHPPEIATLVQARWKARLPEQLGTFYLEETKAYAPFFLDDMSRLNVLSCLCALLNKALPERQTYESLYTKTLDFLNQLSSNNFQSDYVRFEVELLSALGFALDLSTCAGGGDKNDLAYVSPKSGRAVSRLKGQPYHNQLLPLPRFLWQDATATIKDLQDGLALTGYFLHEHLMEHLPAARSRILSDLLRSQNG